MMQADIGEAASNKRSFRSSLKTDSTQQSSKRASRERPAARDVPRGVAREGRTLLSGSVVTFRHPSARAYRPRARSDLAVVAVVGGYDVLAVLALLEVAEDRARVDAQI